MPGKMDGLPASMSPRPMDSAKSGRGGGFRAFLAAVSLLVAAAVVAVYNVRPPALDPVTVLPVWGWVLPGVLLALIGWSRRARILAPLALIAWAVVALHTAEEPRFALRTPEAGNRMPARASLLRIVTLNCQRGQIAAAKEALAEDADIILLQERPSREALEQLVSTMPDWSMAAGGDTAILVRGTAEPVAVPSDDSRLLCAAQVEIPLGQGTVSLWVASVHLSVPQLKPEKWLKSGWAGALQQRARREGEIAGIEALLKQAQPDCPVIVGGDFNAPGGDTLFAPLGKHLTDAFFQAGWGWPDTFPNRLPLSRIDRIWVSRDLGIDTARVIRSRHSNHRMVVADLAPSAQAGAGGREASE